MSVPDAEREEARFLTGAVARLCAEADSDNAVLVALTDCLFVAAKATKMTPAGLMAMLMMRFQQDGIPIPPLIVDAVRGLHEHGDIILHPDFVALFDRLVKK